MKLTHIILLLLVASFSLSANTNSKAVRQSYIEEFSYFAKQEMQRSGVPASIILAQGIVESNAGQSELSLESLNHFGIKCKDWKGRKVHYKDDDLDKDGNLIKSCFRAYDSVLDSYADHSDFLRSGQRYQWLFELETTDYRGWALGLKKSGYATNPQYGNMLISIIEEYGLYVYDLPHNGSIGKLVLTTPQINNEGLQPTVSEPEIMETPTYQLNQYKKKKRKKRRNRITRKIAAVKVRTVNRPIMHGVSTR